MRNFYKTVIQVEVLSEGPYKFESLEGVAFDIINGDCSGRTEVVSSKRLGRKAFVEAGRNKVQTQTSSN